MGRSPLGDAAKTKSVTVKVSEHEKALLRSWGYKTPGLAARQGLDLLIAQRQAGTEPAAPVDPDVAALERVIPRVPTEITTPCRVHRAYEVTKEWYEFGNKWQTKVCGDCGYENTQQVTK
jgi:hypothetical protein